jgi:transcriptional regulator GlxA family with amidase domain
MKCTLLALEGCPLSSVAGPLEILSLANALVGKEHRISLQIVGEGQNIDCFAGMQLRAHGSLSDVQQTDLLIIGAIGHPGDRSLDIKPATLNWIKSQYQQGAALVSICSGAFVLAATGLLDGKQATTHWATEDLFRSLYPNVNLQSEQMLTQDGNLYCSGGASAYQDMSIYLVQKYYGEDVAQQVARRALIDMDRHNQNIYRQFMPTRQHQDTSIHQVQNWLKQHAYKNVSIDMLAQQSHLSERQLKRRFKQATGLTPLGYIQELRIEHAKHLLQSTNQQVEKVANSVGYEDLRFFRQLFKRLCGLAPTEYRSKFSVNTHSA